MLKKNKNKQQEIFSGTLDTLMTKEHFLRDLDKLVDFDFIYEKVSFLYSDKGRPSVDPVVIIKMLLIGYFYGIDSERRLQEEVSVNIAYRWFLRIGLNDSIPDHSTFSQLRCRKFKGTNVFQEIFDEIVCKCIEAGIVDGKLLLTDSIHIRANADNSKRETVTVPIRRLNTQYHFGNGVFPLKNAINCMIFAPKKNSMNTADTGIRKYNRYCTVISCPVSCPAFSVTV